MKEATGELNMTVVTIVAIAALVAFFYLVIWPTIQRGMALTSACSSAGGAVFSTTLDDGSTITCTADNTKTATNEAKCTYKDQKGKTTQRACG